MYHVYGSSFHGGIGKRNFSTFVTARFARIYPLHLVTLLYLLALYALIKLTHTPISWWNVFFDPSAIPSQLLLVQAMGTHSEATWNSPTWSISVEWWAYIVFPFLIVLLANTKAWSRWALGIFIIGGYLAIMFYLQPAFWAQRWVTFGLPADVPYPTGIIDVVTGSAFLRCLCGFVYGMLIFELYTKGWAKRFLKSGYIFLGAWLALFVFWHIQVLPDPVAVFIFGVMIISAAWNEDNIGKLINGRFITYIGDISYSLYLVHMPILLTFIIYRKAMYQPDLKEIEGALGYSFTLTESWMGLIIFLVITFILSGLSYKYLEKPARNYIKKRSS